ncbi:MAG: alpha/beta hydrolase [Rhodobiaceae bacterium]|nr:alpha/beta hydrolase [Rhodobiaceae bacterium]MCC0014070.1 alpha/beta hydrolase [Rhodobiaceae bacterium]MCC0051660.1 alpha/beta hydrolase [Rhodobiaceae bacterium]MCC0061968.1 alpha/beta hydrolase [Rhodobiaceae bacterium]
MSQSGLTLDPAVFDPASISAETKAINAGILKALSGLPDMWTFPPQVIRDRRAQGLGPFPVVEPAENARVTEIEGRGGPIPLRIIAPLARDSRGVYLHIHGGGWVVGAARENDPRLQRIAENTGLTVVSVDYRLSPEHPYPAGPDDCEDTALWLLSGGLKDLGGGALAIGGESAGAHLSVLTLIRLRDVHRVMPFAGANLVAGCYDLRQTPSVRRWGTEKLVLNTRDIEKFCECFVQGEYSVEDPAISPMLADLSGLCPALFSVGTRDLLLDDTLMMAPLWAAAGNDTELGVFPGGAHVFQAFPGKLAQDGLRRIDDFLNAAIAAA